MGIEIHASHKDRYNHLLSLKAKFSSELYEVQREMHEIEMSCINCGGLDFEYDWDYSECYEDDDGDMYGGDKIEYTICKKCGHKEITYEG